MQLAGFGPLNKLLYINPGLAKMYRNLLALVALGFSTLSVADATSVPNFKSPVLSPNQAHELIIQYLITEHSGVNLVEYDVSITYDFTYQQWDAFFICNDKAVQSTGCHFLIRATNDEQPTFQFKGGK